MKRHLRYLSALLCASLASFGLAHAASQPSAKLTVTTEAKAFADAAKLLRSAPTTGPVDLEIDPA
ncbi:MAG TPA: hypothetical protein VK178_10695, partial [Opitutaceae bacterium]|nr:hypothetical protein [Opitutaceae bacterium]